VSTTTALHRPPLAPVSTLAIIGLSPAAVARGKAWGVGTILEGTEQRPGGTSSSVRIVITAVGEREVLARRVDDPARSETLWVFDSRDWTEVS